MMQQVLVQKKSLALLIQQVLVRQAQVQQSLALQLAQVRQERVMLHSL
jgi:hypothetical protein